MASLVITGPMSVSRSKGLPTTIRDALSISLDMKAPYTDSWTYAREAAEHFCPENRKAEAATPSAASSRSASPLTMTGFFEPISAMTRRPWMAERMIALPTPREPVKATPSTSLFTRASPAS